MPEGGFEERSLGFYYVNNDSTVTKAKTLSTNRARNQIVVEIPHFSFGMGLTIQVILVSNGIISNPVPVQNVANNVIAELSDFAAQGFRKR
jgi:hypothetical protein